MRSKEFRYHRSKIGMHGVVGDRMVEFPKSDGISNCRFPMDAAGHVCLIGNHLATMSNLILGQTGYEVQGWMTRKCPTTRQLAVLGSRTSFLHASLTHPSNECGRLGPIPNK